MVPRRQRRLADIMLRLSKLLRRLQFVGRSISRCRCRMQPKKTTPSSSDSDLDAIRIAGELSGYIDRLTTDCEDKFGT